jgi:peptidoglycan/LPS O-acetylase OafA/YrhL
MVLASHAAISVPSLAKHPLLLYTVFNGNRGVSVFFVISGFLITSLLLKEEESIGKISLKSFYIRRIFRILPPFWAFLAVVSLLWKLGTIQTSWSQLAVALTFARDYISGDWWTGHSWSLSVEEQFYLLWPATLVLIGKRKSLWIAFGLILAASGIRVLSHFFITGKTGPIENYMFHMRMDSLMFGCVMALVQKSPVFERLENRLLSWPGMFAALSFFLFVSGYLNQRFQAYYMYPFGYTLEGFAISYLLLYFVKMPKSTGGRLLNSKPIVHVGLISYSLYLWQQLFLSSPLDAPSYWSASALGKFPLNVVAAFVAAELSWKFIEQPALKFRRRFEGQPTTKPKPDLNAATTLSASESSGKAS